MSPEQAEMSGLASGIDAMRRKIREKELQRPSTRLATLGADQLTTTAKRRSADTSKLLHQLQGDLDWIVMKCLEKDRQRRYASPQPGSDIHVAAQTG